MDGQFLEDKIIKHILEDFITKLSIKNSELDFWKDKPLILPEGFNRETASAEEIEKAKNALFVVRNNAWTEIPNAERKKKEKGDYSYAKEDRANRDIVIYELIHDKNGNLIYHNDGYPLYRRKPIMNIECKTSHLVNFEKINKEILIKRQDGRNLTKKEKSLWIVENFFKWAAKKKDLIKKYPSIRNIKYDKNLILTFLTTLTQSDNSYLVCSYSLGEKNTVNGIGTDWSWGYVSKNDNKKTIICPEINVSNLRRFMNEYGIEKMPRDIKYILNLLTSKDKITKEDREYFKFGSDQKCRPLSVIDKDSIKEFGKIDEQGIVKTNDSFLNEIYNCKNVYTKKSMKKIVNNYLKLIKEIDNNKKLNENKIKIEEIINKQQNNFDILNNIDNFNRRR